MRTSFLIMALALSAALLVPQALMAAVEIIIDNPEATMVGEWTTGTMTMSKYGDDYYWCFISTLNGRTATYTPYIPVTSDDWEVYTWYPAGENRPTQAQYIIYSASGDNYKYVNQQINDGVWVYLGTYTMEAGTDNYVRITNYGGETNKVVMADAIRFYSPNGGDTTPPVISNVSASPGSNSAVITWTTNEPATSQVEYGETAGYGNQTTKDTNLVTSHSVTVTGLSPSTLHHYRVKSDDASGNPAVSGDYTFTTTTLDTTPPVISNVNASPGADSAWITWTTDEPATSQVEYGETAGYGNQTTKDTNLVTSHSVTVTGLSPSTLYHYRVKSEDGAGNPAVSGDYTFTTTGTTPEYRAIWADSWGSAFLNSTETTNFINSVAGANYNVIIPEIRKAGDAYYDSAYEPWATNISEGGYDPLADMITKAHAQGIEVHGWLVAYRIWRTNWPSPPPDHIWSVHPDWAMKTSSGGIADGESYNLDPGVPGVQQYICDVVKDIVSKYGIDGINFDYIRYPGTSWGYNELTKQRFYDEYGYWPPTSSGDPNWGTWCDYRRQQVTDLVKKCYVEAMYINPNIKMSVDGVAWMGGDPNVDFTSTSAYYSVFQDFHSWMQDHIIDINVLMNYKREYNSAQAADYRLWTDYIANNKFGRHSVDGNAAYLNSIADSITQMQYGRSAGCDGLCNYSYRVTNKDGQPRSSFFSAVLTNLYQNPAPIPQTPWKSTTGIIFGQVTDASLPNDPIYQDWIYKAEVTISGPVVQSTFTDATGTYGFLDLPAGTYTITCSKSGFPTRTYTGQVLATGQVLRKDFELGYTTASSPAGTVKAGWSLISLPLEPTNPDPVSVFSGIDIDAKLYRWDKPTQSLVVYDEWNPSEFGNVNVDEGYWLQTSSAATISYQAYAGTPATHTIPIVKAGWSIIGCPFLTDRQWADTEVTLGAQTVSLETARNNGWLNSLGYWWDSNAQSLKTLGLPDDWPDSEVVQPWHGYWIQGNVDGLALVLQ